MVKSGDFWFLRTAMSESERIILFPESLTRLAREGPMLFRRKLVFQLIEDAGIVFGNRLSRLAPEGYFQET